MAIARDALGFVFTTSCVDAIVAARAQALFGSLPMALPSARVVDVPVATDDPDLTHMLSRVNLAAIDAAAGQLLLHAGAVARTDGRVAIMIGPSGSGKTTLTLRLTALGLSYVTDEVVCLDPGTLRLTPFRKPVVLKTGAHRLFPQLQPTESGHGSWVVAPTSFDGTIPPVGPLSPALLVFPTYTPGAECDVRLVPEEEVAYLVGEQTSRLHDVLEPLPALARLARRALAVRVVHGDVDLAARAVSDLLKAA